MFQSLIVGQQDSSVLLQEDFHAHWDTTFMLKHLVCPSSEIKEIRILNLESQERQNNAYATGASAVEKSIPRELT